MHALSVLVFLPLAGGLLIMVGARGRAAWARWGSLFFTAAELALVVVLAFFLEEIKGNVLYVERVEWIPSIGVQYLLVMDGVSLWLAILTALLSLIGILVSWHAIDHHWPAFAFLILATETSVMGVFLALDLVLFYAFWELMLVPMYFLIALWGHGRRLYSAYKFFLFTVTGSLLMLVAILGLYFIHGEQSGRYTFDYYELLKTHLSYRTAMWLMLGFFAAFAVKVPVFPVHSWLPDAHTEAPTAGSILLAGLLLKTGAYGLLRFCLPLFPDVSASFAPVGMALGVIGILYGALLALVQQDMKRLIAYSSISHLGFVVLGIYAWTQQSLNGAFVLMLAHGVTTGAMFAVVGMLEERTHTRILSELGGLFAPMPRMAVLLLLFTLSAMGMPGLANFVGEFLVLAGAFQIAPAWAVAGALGIIAGVVYLLWMYQRSMLGDMHGTYACFDLDARERLLLILLALSVLWLGLYPVTFLDAARAPLYDVLQLAPALSDAGR
jgi:proton-translocating NADH-quinone oxidoreductase, chain M